MHKKVRHQNLVSNNNGSVIIEFSFIVFIMIIFIKILMSISEYYSTIGKLDRISYSLAGIVRERTLLYSNNSELTRLQVNQLKKVAENMLLHSGLSKYSLSIKVEKIHFNTTQSSSTENKIIDNTKSLSFNIGSCEPDKLLRELTQLSSFSNAGRWIPLYQVTLCLPVDTWYSQLFSQGGNANYIKSSSITIER